VPPVTVHNSQPAGFACQSPGSQSNHTCTASCSRLTRSQRRPHSQCRRLLLPRRDKLAQVQRQLVRFGRRPRCQEAGPAGCHVKSIDVSLVPARSPPCHLSRHLVCNTIHQPRGLGFLPQNLERLLVLAIVAAEAQRTQVFGKCTLADAVVLRVGLDFRIEMSCSQMKFTTFNWRWCASQNLNTSLHKLRLPGFGTAKVTARRTAYFQQVNRLSGYC